MQKDSELDKLVKLFFSRSSSNMDDKETKKLLKSLSEKFLTHFKNKGPNYEVPLHILAFENYVYARAISNLKKVLKYLH